MALDDDFKAVIIRDEDPGEESLSDGLIREAFGRENEARLVETIRQSPGFNPKLSLVAQNWMGVMGYALFSPVTVQAAPPVRAAVLHPVAVGPKYRKLGAGERFVRHGAQRCSAVGINLIFTISAPRFFARLGFVPAQSAGFTPDIALSKDSFLALDLTGTAIGKVSGTVVFPEPFKK